jgi:site-specific DNA-methyltransferase (cytosine-N4-specific)
MRTIHKIILANSQKMIELDESSIHLMVTSPPYPMIKMWDSQFANMNSKTAVLWRELKNTVNEQIVARIYDEMHETLSQTWKETFRVLIEGGIACINIGDATRTLNGTFRLFPNHSRIIETCERIGFNTLPYILWKKPTKKPRYKGKAAFLGSGFLPTNAYVTLDCEFILLFRKGNPRKFPPKDPRRYESAFTKEQRNKWFTQIWNVAGTRQRESKLDRRTAAYPDEIAGRLMKMFSIKGDTVLDPFLGSGTTVKLAIQNERNSVGYENDEALLPLIKDKISNKNQQFVLEYVRRTN